jgi:hypothetical protein
MQLGASRRWVWESVAAGFAATVLGCGGSSTQTSSPSSPSSPSGPSSGDQASLKLTLRGLTGRESLMNVRFNIGSQVLARGSAAAVLSQLHSCTTDTASLVCTSAVPVGDIVSLFAVEASDGSAVPLHGATSVPAEPTSITEFVQFTGDCQLLNNVGFGDCAVVTSAAREYDVEADFSLMNTVVFNAIGAGMFTVSVHARDQLAIPTLPNGIQTAGPGTYNFIIGGQAAPTQVDWLPIGSTVSVTAAGENQAQFLKWTGCTSGGGNACTLTTPTAAASPVAATATAFFQYWNCGNNTYADGPATGCTLVNPSSVRSVPVSAGASSSAAATVEIRR